MKSVFYGLATVLAIVAGIVLVNRFFNDQPIVRSEPAKHQPSEIEISHTNDKKKPLAIQDSKTVADAVSPEREVNNTQTLDEAIDWLKQNGFDSPSVNDVLATILFANGGSLKYEELIAFIKSGTVNDENIVKLMDILGDGFEGDIDGNLSQAQNEKDRAIQQIFMDQLHTPSGSKSFFKALSSLNILVSEDERYTLFEESLLNNSNLGIDYDAELVELGLDYSIGSTYRQMPDVMNRLFDLDETERRGLIHMVAVTYQSQVISNSGFVSGIEELDRYITEHKPNLENSELSLDDQLEFVSWYSLKELSEGHIPNRQRAIDWVGYLEQDGTPAEILAVFDYYEDPEKIHNRAVPDNVLASNVVYEKVREGVKGSKYNSTIRSRLKRVQTIIESHNNRS